MPPVSDIYHVDAFLSALCSLYASSFPPWKIATINLAHLHTRKIFLHNQRKKTTRQSATHLKRQQMHSGDRLAYLVFLMANSYFPSALLFKLRPPEIQFFRNSTRVWWTDWRTDQRTDTSSYRDARTQISRRGRELVKTRWLAAEIWPRVKKPRLCQNEMNRNLS